MNDGEVEELNALGIHITTTNDIQDKAEFEVELTDEQAACVRSHDAVYGIIEL